jgi:hypothetical protein
LANRQQSNTGCLVALGVFVGVAVPIFAVSTWYHDRARPERNPQIGLIVAAVCAALGGAMIFGGVGGRKRAAAAAALREAHPNEPWKWSGKWNDGEIRDSNTTALAVLWVVAIVWNSVMLASGGMGLRDLLTAGRVPIALIPIALITVGALLLLYALYATLRVRKFGVSTFRMPMVPAFTGGRLVGTIHTGARLDSADGVRLHLTCVRKTATGTGEDRNVTMTTEWDDEQRLTRLLPGGPSRTEIPVCFDVPTAAAPTDDTNPDNTITWRLEASARLSGTNYWTRFDVPVFNPPDERSRVASAQQPDIAAPYRAPDSAESHTPRDRGIQITTSSAGGRSFHFAAARNKGVALSTTIFSLIFGAVAVLTKRNDIPVVVPIIAGLIALPLTWATLKAWLGSATVTVDRHRLTVVQGVPGLCRPREFARDQIQSIDCDSNFQAGMTKYYNVTLRPETGKRVRLASGIPGNRDADLVVAMMRESLAIRTDEK